MNITMVVASSVPCIFVRGGSKFSQAPWTLQCKTLKSNSCEAVTRGYLKLRMPTLSTGKRKERFPTKPPIDTDAMLDNARKASDFLKAISHETRLLILCLLIDGEKTVNELEQILELRQAAVSQQLARLRADDLVEARRNGKSVHYSLARPDVIEVISALYRTFCR